MSPLLYFVWLPCQVDLSLTAVKWDWIDLMGAVKVISPPFLIVEGRAFIFRSNSMHSRTSVCVCVCMRAHDTSVCVYMCPRIFYLRMYFPERSSTLVGERWTGLSRAHLIFVVAVASSRKLPGTNAKSMLIRGGISRNLRNRENRKSIAVCNALAILWDNIEGGVAQPSSAVNSRRCSRPR